MLLNMSLVVALGGCSPEWGLVSTVSSGILGAAIIPRLQPEIERKLEPYVGVEQASVRKMLASATAHPAAFKLSVALQTLNNPWQGLTHLERNGLQIAELAVESGNLAALIGVLESGMDRAAEPLLPVPPSESETAADQISYLLAVLVQATELREKALEKLTQKERRFLFDHASEMVENFIPQISEQDDHSRLQRAADFRFCSLVAEKVDYSMLIAAAQILVRLADERQLERLRRTFLHYAGHAANPPGVTGEVLLVQDTPYGLIVVGGPGPNTYALDERFALVLDVGGDDVYRGSIAAPSDAVHGISVVIDLSGNDTYISAPLGLATGRMGLGILIDRDGDDVYYLSQGAGGTGFAGIGILYDAGGNDQYLGAKLTQGAAIAGLGVLLDKAGDDTYTSFGYAIGFGGPMGLGAVVDVAGNDRYQCGNHYPSGYNSLDAPQAKPGDLLFQYEGFCMGTGSGQRVFPADAQSPAYDLAGGWGMLIDLQGHDSYWSANFSQGCGYFFGVGLKLDLGGNDEHMAARYGHAAAAHFGVGLFIDYDGEDTYDSTGPLYNGGTAWDRSVTLFVDAGEGNDTYDLRRSDGLGRADYHSWAVFVDMAGRDRYLVPNGMGMASHGSMSAFFDLAGNDDYALVPQSGRRANGRTFVEQEGGLFVDQ